MTFKSVKKPKALITTASLAESNPFGSNWRSPGANSGDLGTGAAIRPDPTLAAAAWKKSGGKDKAEWEEHAKRLGLFPQDIEPGWLSINGPDLNTPPKGIDPTKAPSSSKPTSGPPIGATISRAVSRDESLGLLRAALGEAVAWWGYSVPNFHQLKMPQTPNTGGFGFHTVAAERVWAEAKKVADKDPKETTLNIISKACEQAQVTAFELTPEDNSLLDMAINWYLSGKASGMETPTPPANGNKAAGIGVRGAP